MKNQGIIIGIDLGTTNSCAARWNSATRLAEVIENAEGKRTTPSYVTYDTKLKSFKVGESSKKQAIMHPNSTLYGVKRLIQRKLNDVQKQVQHSSYKIVAGKEGLAYVDRGDGTKMSPSEVAAQILKKIKHDTEQKLGQEIKKAVITVPAYFNDAQRQATKDAGTIAGLDVVRIINEPTAAALAYGIDKNESAKVAVYDLGGGTFDVSILDLSDGVFEVMSTNGDSTLGGEDFDESIIKFLVDEFKTSTGIDISNDSQAMQRIKTEAERAKIELSTSDQVDINLPFLSANANGPQHLNTTLTRGKLESLVANLIEKTKTPCLNALSDAKLKPSEINEVILVGGMTRMPAVQNFIAKVFEKDVSKLNKSVNPDEVVAMGAAIQGAVLTGDAKDVVLLDVTPLSLGIETLGGVFTKLIERNSTIPCKQSQVFSTAQDNQSAVTIKVAQGERSMFNDNKLLGQFNLEGIPPAAKGIPQIEVTFDIDANGIVHVSAKDKSSGNQQNITIQASGGLTEEEIEKMKQDAEKYAESDKKNADYVSLRSKSDTLISSSEMACKEGADKIPNELKESVQKSIEELRTALTKNSVENFDELQSAYDKLNTESMKIGEHLYKKSNNDSEKTSETNEEEKPSDK